MTWAEASPSDAPRVIRQHCDAFEHGGHLAGGFDRDDLPNERPCQHLRTPAPWRAAPSGASSSHTTSSTPRQPPSPPARDSRRVPRKRGPLKAITDVAHQQDLESEC